MPEQVHRPGGAVSSPRAGSMMAPSEPSAAAEKALATVLTKHAGFDGLPAPDRVQALLSDLCRGEARREIRGLILALREGIAAEIASAVSATDATVHRRMHLRLTSDFGLDPTFAAWICETWLRVLGKEMRNPAITISPTAAAPPALPTSGDLGTFTAAVSSVPPPLPNSVGQATPPPLPNDVRRPAAPRIPVAAPPRRSVSPASAPSDRTHGEPPISTTGIRLHWPALAVVSLGAVVVGAVVAVDMSAGRAGAEQEVARPTMTVGSTPAMPDPDPVMRSPAAPTSLETEEQSSMVSEALVDEMASFADSSLALAMGHDADAYVANFADDVHLFGNHVQDRETIINDFFAYAARWPQREFRRSAPPRVTRRGPDTVMAEYPYRWAVASPERGVQRRGESVRNVTVVWSESGWRIIALNERVVARAP